MRHQAPIAVTAVIAALTLASGVSTAAAADESKPTVREVAKLSAPDADTAAAAQAPARMFTRRCALRVVEFFVAAQ